MQARYSNKLDYLELFELPKTVCKGFEHALQEAATYVGQTSPNPPVGCAILDKAGNLLACEAHHRAGEAHAEILALRRCAERGLWEKISDVMVTLEPCNHTGQTPPCSEALLNTPAKRIWVGMKDPNPKVCGNGNIRLRQGGKKVILLQDLSSIEAKYYYQQCCQLLLPFTKAVTKNQAWITVKQALSVSGSMLPPKGQKTFTSFNSLTIAHKLRRATEAIITTAATIRADRPNFTVRHIPDHINKKRLLVICTRQKADLHALCSESYLRQAQANGFQFLVCRNLRTLPELLYQHHVLWAMVEAGPNFLKSIQQLQIWDDWLLFQQSLGKEDTISVQSKHPLTPLSSLLTHVKFHRVKEVQCSLVS
ncbi:hypothetical protein COMNV_00721 [Commensalibacter sp. Nvir]|uniref:bifunctional diaminohydroxyphosphoribosylaminopyrimidine deaminase/5-amino-6-(5-phosphoribosylamino)uracil reductase RibD n=1 Tax=Commensalibacter sp. Nvir TaxID=3069817 RepID=UPI002D4A528D|nr:hypothetical protein COMNV_00721 [Commensalibacter sp. Nvir]